MTHSSSLLSRLYCLLSLTLLLALIPWQVQAAAVPPTVRVMPPGLETTTQHTAYAWAGTPVTIWGNVTWGDATSGDWEWDVNNDGTADYLGSIANPRDIAVSHTYPTAGTYFATLKVTDADGLSDTATVRIDVVALPNAENKVQINLAIERGLKWLYLTQNSNGYWYDSIWVDSTVANTALAVLAFENRDHRPISDDSDIYKDTVQRGLNSLFYTLNYHYVDPDNPGGYQDYEPGNPDSNGDHVLLGLDGSMYTHGMVMMAIAAAGPYQKGANPLDPVINPALNLTVPEDVANIGGWTYYRVLQDMVDWATWAQADSWGWGRGGWRYTPDSGEADNSAAQWPVIGMEAAEGWGIMAPNWVKSELKTYWLFNSYKPSVKGWGYSDTNYVTTSHAGSGLSMLAYVAVPKTESWYQDALNSLANHWNDSCSTYEGWGWDYWPCHWGNYYAMYGVAKAARIARDSGGNVSEITQIGTHDWYAEYATYLLGQQQSAGNWPSWWGYFSSTLNTGFALLILEPTISSLRPQAAITASPNPTPANQDVTFNISGSSHQDSNRFLVSWKLDYDDSNGVNWHSPDVSGNFPAQPIVKTGGYPETGANYAVTATLQVTDDQGVTDEQTVVVQVTSENVPPVAVPGGPYSGSVGFPVTISGGASFDPNPGDSIVSWEWDLNGDGAYNDASGEVIQHTWTTPYTGVIGLKVTDSHGVSSTATAYTSITVTDLRPVSYPLIKATRISRLPPVWDYEFSFVIANQGNGNAIDVKATLQNWPSQVTTVWDGSVSFGDVAAGATVTSGDTFKIRVNRATPIANSDLTWKLEFTDAGGTRWTLSNFPLYLP